MDAEYVLVTGAAGFVGSKITSELLRRERKVIALDCFLSDLYSADIKEDRWRNLSQSPHSANLIRIKFDLRKDDLSTLDQFNITSVINEAAMPGLSSDWSRFNTYYECNLTALNRLLEYSKSLKLTSFIQASTSSVYGVSAVGDETVELKPMSPYGVSKLAAEKLLLAYLQWFGTPVKILRYYSVYGPGQRPDMAYARIISALKSGKEFTIYGDGQQRRSNTYIDDIVKATLLAEQVAPAGSILNICGDETYSLNQVISILEDLSGLRLKKNYASNKFGDQKDTSGDNSRAKYILGWQAETNLISGLAQQLDHHTNVSSL